METCWKNTNDSFANITTIASVTETEKNAVENRVISIRHSCKCRRWLYPSLPDSSVLLRDFLITDRYFLWKSSLKAPNIVYVITEILHYYDKMA